MALRRAASASTALLRGVALLPSAAPALFARRRSPVSLTSAPRGASPLYCAGDSDVNAGVAGLRLHTTALRPLTTPTRPTPQRACLHTAALCRSIFIQVEQTPNPDSIKFVPEGHTVLPEEFGTGLVRGGAGARGHGAAGMT